MYKYDECLAHHTGIYTRRGYIRQGGPNALTIEGNCGQYSYISIPFARFYKVIDMTCIVLLTCA